LYPTPRQHLSKDTLSNYDRKHTGGAIGDIQVTSDSNASSYHFCRWKR
jgi:hypothetical protein